jgi:hypothetical protein
MGNKEILLPKSAPFESFHLQLKVTTGSSFTLCQGHTARYDYSITSASCKDCFYNDNSPHP